MKKYIATIASLALFQYFSAEGMDIDISGVSFGKKNKSSVKTSNVSSTTKKQEYYNDDQDDLCCCHQIHVLPISKLPNSNKLLSQMMRTGEELRKLQETVSGESKDMVSRLDYCKQ